ncbi:phosphoribosyltransferase [Streptomyces sp. B22F1]|uniref:phosphoribosyltransferase n=1 Tax=Streptomyces sp. B22F1 TaxID=3153566 RepID=UPI00325C67F7
MIDSVRDFSSEWSSDVLIKNEASKAETRRTQIIPGLFTASPAVKGKRILLFDDTFTTGGTMGSAAYALKQARASLVVGLSFGRQLRADWKDSREFVASLAERKLEINKCVVHGGRRADPSPVFRPPG